MFFEGLCFAIFVEVRRICVLNQICEGQGRDDILILWGNLAR